MLNKLKNVWEPFNQSSKTKKGLKWTCLGWCRKSVNSFILAATDYKRPSICFDYAELLVDMTMMNVEERSLNLKNGNKTRLNITSGKGLSLKNIGAVCTAFIAIDPASIKRMPKNAICFLFGKRFWALSCTCFLQTLFGGQNLFGRCLDSLVQVFRTLKNGPK